MTNQSADNSMTQPLITPRDEHGNVIQQDKPLLDPLWHILLPCGIALLSTAAFAAMMLIPGGPLVAFATGITAFAPILSVGLQLGIITGLSLVFGMGIAAMTDYEAVSKWCAEHPVLAVLRYALMPALTVLGPVFVGLSAAFAVLQPALVVFLSLPYVVMQIALPVLTLLAESVAQIVYGVRGDDAEQSDASTEVSTHHLRPIEEATLPPAFFDAAKNALKIKNPPSEYAAIPPELGNKGTNGIVYGPLPNLSNATTQTGQQLPPPPSTTYPPAPPMQAAQPGQTGLPPAPAATVAPDLPPPPASAVQQPVVTPVAQPGHPSPFPPPLNGVERAAKPYSTEERISLLPPAPVADTPNAEQPKTNSKGKPVPVAPPRRGRAQRGRGRGRGTGRPVNNDPAAIGRRMQLQRDARKAAGGSALPRKEVEQQLSPAQLKQQELARKRKIREAEQRAKQAAPAPEPTLDSNVEGTGFDSDRAQSMVDRQRQQFANMPPRPDNGTFATLDDDAAEALRLELAHRKQEEAARKAREAEISRQKREQMMAHKGQSSIGETEQQTPPAEMSYSAIGRQVANDSLQPAQLTDSMQSEQALAAWEASTSANPAAGPGASDAPDFARQVILDRRESLRGRDDDTFGDESSDDATPPPPSDDTQISPK